MAESGSAKGSVLVQAGILAAASMLVRVIGLLYRSPLTAIIGDEGNGYYGTAYNIYTIILMISSYSIPSAISKLMAQKLAVQDTDGARKVFRCAFGYGILVGLLGSLLLYFGASFLVPEVAVCVLQVFAPTVFLFGILGSLRGYFQAQGSMVQTSISQILEQIANAAVSIGAAWLLMSLAAGEDSTTQAQMGAMGSAMGTGAGVLTALIFMTVCYVRSRRREPGTAMPASRTAAGAAAVGGGTVSGRRTAVGSGTVSNSGTVSGISGAAASPIRRHNDFPQILKETILVITPFMLSGVILNITTSLNQTIYMRILINGRGVAETAATTVYGVFSNKAVVISNIPISIATAVAAAIIPGISAAFARRDLEDTRRRAGDAVRATALIAIPSAVGLFVLARPITMLLFPQMETLSLASSLLAGLAVTVIFYSVSTITNAILQSIGRMNIPLISAGIAIAVQTVVLFALLLLTDWDVEALVLCSILYSALIFVVNLVCLKRFLGFTQDVMSVYVRPLLCAAIMGAAARLVYEGLYYLTAGVIPGSYLRNLAAVLPAVLIAVLVYAFVLVRSGTVEREMLRHLPKGDAMVRLLEKWKWLRS